MPPAGSGKGLQGKHSSNFYDLEGILAAMQQRADPLTPLGYVLENAGTQHDFNSAQVRERDHRLLVKYLGEPVTLDAARVGAQAHKLRNY